MPASTLVTGPLHVVLVAPPWFRLPPDGYGGIESVVAELADRLVLRGHRVTVIGHAGESLRATVVRTYLDPQGDRLGNQDVEVAHAASTRRLLAALRPDIIHDHTLAGPLLAPSRPAPTVATVHGPVNPDIAMYFEALRDCVQLVAISHAQRRADPRLPWLATVHNAVSVDAYPFRSTKDDYVLFLGRCSPDKGVHLAVEAARAAGRRLLLAMKCSEPTELEYFEAKVRPLLGPDTDYVGEVQGARKLALLAGARALICPVRWEEPFGMVAIEAMACGTPVVGLARGALPETVDDGVTGLLVHEPEDLPAAIEAAERLDPHACRVHVETRFSGAAMAAAYEDAYVDVLTRAKRPLHLPTWPVRPAAASPAPSAEASSGV